MISSFLNIFSKLQVSHKNFDVEPPLFAAPAIITENGYEAIPVHFFLFPLEIRSAPSIIHKKRGSCFELLRRLVKKSQSAMPLEKDAFITILTRNSTLWDDLKSVNCNNINSKTLNDSELFISVENGPLLRIPTFDFAIARLEDSLSVCTALEEIEERVHFQVTNFSSALEEVLKSFMTFPRESSLGLDESQQLPLPLLPSIDLSKVVVQPSTVFEMFKDNSSGDDDGEEAENIDDSRHIVRSGNINNYQEKEKSTKAASTSTFQESHAKPKRSESSMSKTSSTGGFRQCLNCFCTSTPMWRRGPDGTASLCNACGVRFKAGKLQMDNELVEDNLKKINQHRSLIQQQQQQNQSSQEQVIRSQADIILHQY